MNSETDTGRSEVGDCSGVQLGDKRLVSRLEQVVRALEARPDTAFPSAMGPGAELEGSYRFLGDDRASTARARLICVRVQGERAAVPLWPPARSLGGGRTSPRRSLLQTPATSGSPRAASLTPASSRAPRILAQSKALPRCDRS